MRRALVRIISALGVIASSVAGDVYNNRSACLILYSNPRWAEPFECMGCLVREIGKESGTADVLFLDGHSTPPNLLLERSREEVVARIVRIAPTTIVAITCWFAELGVMSELFHSLPGLTEIWATTYEIPWRNTMRESPCDWNVGMLKRFSREDVINAEADARQLLADIAACKISPPLAQQIPPYLCVHTKSGQLLRFRITLDELHQNCPPGTTVHGFSFDPC